ncbi:MAG: GerMN domain-containing protein [Geobacter sp.]
MKHRRRIGIDVIVPFVLVALVFGGLVWQKYREAGQLPDAPPGQQGAALVQKVVLFYANDEGQLYREAREVERCGDRSNCLRSLLEELFSGPISDLTNIYPEWTTVNNVTIQNDLAVIDLGGDFVEGLAAGSSAEMLAVYGIVNTVCTNLPEITKVQISIDGNRQARLRHLDLSDPLVPYRELEAPQLQPSQERS